MGRMAACIAATVLCCGILYHFFPGTADTAFIAKGFHVTWMAMLFCGVLYGWHRVSK